MEPDSRRAGDGPARGGRPRFRGAGALRTPGGLAALALVGLLGAVLGSVAAWDRPQDVAPETGQEATASDAAAPASDAPVPASDATDATSGRAASREGDSAVAAEGTGSAVAGERAGSAGAPEPVEWASPSEPSPVEPVPAEARVPKPAAVRGIYVGSWPVGNPDRFDRLIALAEATEINAFVVDVKDVKGVISYPSRVPLARQIGATEEVRIPDMRAALARLRERGIYPIARIVVFKDPLLASARPEWAIRREDGSVWEDNNGVRWVDSYNRNVWEYNIQLAREAIALGFSEIQWDYIRFPDAPSSYLREAVYPARDGRSRTEGIREFMRHSQDRLADLDVPVTADVFGITTSAHNDVGIGQLWEEMADVMDVLLPMVYPSHYPSGSWSYENPNAAPYQIVKKAMDHGVARSTAMEDAATIRPWLQAFSLGEPAYGPRHVRAQIDAVYDAGLSEWILWNPSARYSAEPLVTADGREPWFAGLGATLHPPKPPEIETPTPAHRFEEVEPPALEVRRYIGVRR